MNKFNVFVVNAYIYGICMYYSTYISAAHIYISYSLKLRQKLIAVWLQIIWTVSMILLCVDAKMKILCKKYLKIKNTRKLWINKNKNFVLYRFWLIWPKMWARAIYKILFSLPKLSNLASICRWEINFIVMLL